MAESIRSVMPGQIWQDNDKRLPTPRFLRVERLDGQFAICTQVTENNATIKQRPHRIQITRFKPTATGYRFIKQINKESAEVNA
jgi:hypothetical protein